MSDETETLFDDSDKSEFNAGIATLMRVHEIKKYLDACTISEDHHNQLRYLLAFYKELSPMLSKEKADQRKQWDKALTIKRKFRNSEDITDADYYFLDEWELQLRQIDQDKDMNLPKRSNARWGLARR